MLMSEALGVLENRHSIAILLALVDGPCTKMELYRRVSKNPRMPDKIADLEGAGLVSTDVLENRATVVGLTHKGEQVAELLGRADELLRSGV